ncbi:carbohydrate-binding protein [Chitiniphilus purpureus]|uniref:Carbohydrate-binding protein n=1 Tax=Chitiniphilus purpureus TaxID=2981137 RepID=A0ABY6DJD4_9NEIS|nr:carbohydrate-binding protein [Chitiniphilus sp. CD1]UXY14454.1 carbohydrate-binding protein [Chitiniphilus sp. CD1]
MRHHRSSTLARLLLAAALLVPLGHAWACSPLPSPGIPEPDNRLPVVFPVVAVPATPPTVNGACPSGGQYANHAVLPSLSDEDYQRLFGAALPPTWLAERAYVAGEQVSFGAQAYRARWWTQGEQPGLNNWGAWEAVSTGNGTAAWSAARAYTAGEQALYEGRTYRARWWVSGEAPAASSAWQEVQGTTALGSDLPQLYLANLYRQPDRYDLFLTTRTATVQTPAPKRWEIRADGVTVASGTTFAQLLNHCLPGSNCTPDYSWSAVAQLSLSTLDGARYISVWLFGEGEHGRPTPLLYNAFGKSINR